MFTTTPTLKFFTSCDDISIYSFDKITETGDLRYMVVNYVENEFELSGEDTVKAYDLFKDILSEYFYLSKDTKVNKTLKIEEKLSVLEFKRNTANKIIDLYRSSSEDNSYLILHTVEKLGFKINKDLTTEEQINKILSDIKIMNNKINITRISLEGYKKVKKEKSQSLEAAAMSLEISLKLPYQINTRTTSLHRWICLTKSLKN